LIFVNLHRLRFWVTAARWAEPAREGPARAI
jgi:hypothetical protein